MAKPVSGKIFYDRTTDRPKVSLESGDKRLLTEDDATVGTISEIESGDGSVTVTNGTGPTVDLSVSAVTSIASADGSVTVTNGSGPAVDLSVTVVDTAPQCELWYPPATAHADDIEFDSTTFPADLSWWSGDLDTILTSTSAYSVASSLVPWSSTGAEYTLHSQRQSWLQVQPADGVMHWAMRACTIGASGSGFFFRNQLYSSFAYPGGHADWNQNDRNAGLYFALCADSGGAPDLRRAVVVYIEFKGGSIDFDRLEGKVYDTFNATADMLVVAPGTFSTRGVQYFWLGADGGAPGGDGKVYAAAGNSDFHIRGVPTTRGNPYWEPVWVGFGWRRNEAGGPAQHPIMGFDFLRQKDDLTLPW